MLFDGANGALVRARLFEQRLNVVAKGEALKLAARNIIDNGLKAGLDQEKGGEIRDGISFRLYDYIFAVYCRLICVTRRSGHPKKWKGCSAIFCRSTGNEFHQHLSGSLVK